MSTDSDSILRLKPYPEWYGCLAICPLLTTAQSNTAPLVLPCSYCYTQPASPSTWIHPNLVRETFLLVNNVINMTVSSSKFFKALSPSSRYSAWIRSVLLLLRLLKITAAICMMIFSSFLLIAHIVSRVQQRAAVSSMRYPAFHYDLNLSGCLLYSLYGNNCHQNPATPLRSLPKFMSKRDDLCWPFHTSLGQKNVTDEGKRAYMTIGKGATLSSSY